MKVDESRRFDKIARSDLERDAKAARPEGRRAGSPQ